MKLQNVFYLILLSYEVTGQIPFSEMEPLLLYVNHSKILYYDIDTDESGVLASSRLWSNLVAMDFHHGNQMLYVSDVLLKSLFSVDLSVNPAVVDVILDNGIDVPDGLAVDWINNNLYWTDTGKFLMFIF